MITTTNDIKSIFSKIAHKYDFINFVLSFGMHKIWTYMLLKMLNPKDLLLDLCAGTGEISLAFVKKTKGKAILVDICNEMLLIAKSKSKNYKESLVCITDDVCKLPIANNSIPFITIAYGIRNIENKYESLKEMHRVLQDKGRIGILDLTCPKNKACRILHSLYIRYYLPLIGFVISGNKHAYDYLSKSIPEFTDTFNINALSQSCGLKLKQEKQVLFGSVSIWILEKSMT